MLFGINFTEEQEVMLTKEEQEIWKFCSQEREITEKFIETLHVYNEDKLGFVVEDLELSELLALMTPESLIKRIYIKILKSIDGLDTYDLTLAEPAQKLLTKLF